MRAGIFKKCMIVTLYLSSSTATLDLNKYLVSVLDFKMHYGLIIVQSLIIVTIIQIQLLTSMVTIRYSNINKWWITSALLAVMMLSNMKAVFHIPLALFTLYKNMAIVLVAALEYYFFDHPITIISIISFMLMIGSSVFGNTIEKLKPLGYIWMSVNLVSTAAYVLYLKKLIAIDMSTRTESVFFSNLLSIPILLGLSLKFDDFVVPTMTTGLVVSVLLSGVVAYLTSFSTAWSMKSLSSTSYSMLGAMNKLIVSASGFLLFDEKYEVSKMLALLTGILAGMLYSLDPTKKCSAAAVR